MNEQPKREIEGRDPPYVAFLLRCWRGEEQQRFLLENVATREREGFDSLEAFLEALRMKLADPTRPI